MPPSPIPIIEITSKEPRQRGRDYGESARAQISAIIAVYREIFETITFETWKTSAERAKPFIAQVQAFAPDLMTEIQGIAEGSGQRLEAIFLLNARSEILYHPQVLAQECTSLAALPESTRNGDLLLAQNWDWFKAACDFQVILKIKGHDGKPSLITFTEAGQLAKIGMNSAGIGLVVNNLVSDQPRLGIPWIFLTRRILESSHFAQALGVVLNTRRAHSINFIVGTVGGEAVNLETAPVETHVLWPQDGVLAHANHYLHPGKNFRDLKPLRDVYLSTYLRWRMAQKSLAAEIGNIDETTLRQILTDHLDYPFSICAHEHPKVEPIRQTATCLSIIMNLSRNKIHYNQGNPCQSNFHIIDVDLF